MSHRICGFGGRGNYLVPLGGISDASAKKTLTDTAAERKGRPRDPQECGMLQRFFDLTENVLNTTSGIDIPRYPDDDSSLEPLWYAFVTRTLYQQNKRLSSVALLLKPEFYDFNSAIILTRSIFECAADLVYIAQKKALEENEWLEKYLKHGDVPMSGEEVTQLQEDISGGVQPTLPTQRWMSVGAICKSLGSNWEKACTGDFYRLASVVAHNGAYTLAGDYLELERPRTEKETAPVFYTALAYHFKIAEVAAWVFPKSISIESIQEFDQQLQHLVPRPPETDV